MTSREIIQAIRKKILEHNVGIFTDSDIIRVLNNILLEISSNLNLQSRIKKTTLTFTDGKADLPADYLSFYYATDGAKEFSLRPIENFLEGDENYCLTILENKILVKPDTTTSLDLYYYRKPTEITSEKLNEEPDIDPLFHEVLILGAVYRCFEDMQENELANVYQQKYILLKDERTKLLRKREESGQEGKSLFEYTKLI